jgi:hypothetical protein
MTDRFYDNTRITAYKRCPRYFYYRHDRDWQLDGSSPPLIFGSSWHEAMDVVWKLLPTRDDQNTTTEDIVRTAWAAFNLSWEEEQTPWEEMGDEERKRLGARTPMVALEMLYEYIDAREKILTSPDFELIAIEQPFAVPLHPDDDTLFYVGRIDKVFRWRGDVYAGEHKTTSAYRKADVPFRSNFLDSFSPNSQIDGYLHALHMLYGDEAKAVWIDAALVHKERHDGFSWIQIERQLSQLDSWLFETKTWIDKMEMDKAELAHMREDYASNDSYLRAFPKNTNSCMDYAGCAYLELCKMIPNPEGRSVPSGYTEKHWSPFDELELGKIGLKKDAA